MTLVCVGIDISKGKSTVSAIGWDDAVIMKPHDVVHTASALGELADSLKRPGGEIRVVMEHTGRYRLPVAKVLHDAGLFVCAVNPKLVRDFGDNKLRSIKFETKGNCATIKKGIANQTEESGRKKRV